MQLVAGSDSRDPNKLQLDFLRILQTDCLVGSSRIVKAAPMVLQRSQKLYAGLLRFSETGQEGLCRICGVVEQGGRWG